MGTTELEQRARLGIITWPGERALRRIGVGAVAALAAVLRLANLDALGYVNHYYTAAVVAMLQSWHNFFYLAAEPGGSVSVDKPPVGLWLEAISARVFGVNTFGILLPEILAGILSVIVVYHLVRRRFGTAAGLVAGLVLAVTPVAVATDRNNTIDSILILTLLLAAWAFMKATESRRIGYLLLGGALVGIGFNIKMLEAFLPLPAFYALYLLGSSERLWKKIGKLSLATIVLLVVSLAWVTAVDLTPASQRPYVGSSGDNTETSLIVGYNGLERLLGMGGRGGLLTGLLQSIQNGGTVNPGGFQPGGPNRGGFSAGGGFATRGFFDTGNPGLARLFIAPLSKEASWLLPFAIIAGLLVLFRSRLEWPIGGRHRALVLWGGWLLIGGIFFSVAGFFHEYYLSFLAPAVAALVGIGAGEMWQLKRTRPRLAATVLLAAAAVTLWLQFKTASAIIGLVPWLPLMAGLLLIGATILFATMGEKGKAGAAVAFACVLAALLVTPAIWSGLTNLNPSTNQSLPASYSGGQVSFGPAGHGGAGTSLTGLQVDPSLLAFLEQNTKGEKYLFAVPSSMQGSDYVIATGRPVLYLGGFDGQDQVETAESLAQLVASGQLRYIYASAGFGRGQSSSVSAWAANSCRVVPGYEAQTENAGAPGGIEPGQTSGSGGFGRGGFGGAMQVSLYDCAGAGS